MGNRTFFLPNDAGYVLFNESVLHHMYQHAQTRFFHREAGGQLFSSTPQESAIVVSVATGPNFSDTRKRHAFVPGARQATNDRQSQFDLGRYPVGLWHTHPETDPKPSHQDHTTAQEFLDAFGRDMSGFMLVILGNRGEPLNMTVWLAEKRGRMWTPLRET